jgi:hypothetical protein
MFMIKLVQNRFGVVQSSVFGGQINGGIRLDGLPMGTLTGAREGQQHKFIGSPEFEFGIPADFLFINFGIVNWRADEFAITVYIHLKFILLSFMTTLGTFSQTIGMYGAKRI